MMMMMTHFIKVTLSEEIEEVNFDPTASGRLFSAVQNIIGRSNHNVKTLTVKYNTKRSIFVHFNIAIKCQLDIQKEEEKERQCGGHPGQTKVE